MDMVLNPLLDPEEVEKEREIIQEELRMTYDQPTYRVDLLIDEALWPDQAMGRDVGGTPDTVAAIQQSSIRDYMRQQYNPANTVVAVAGNITHEEVVDALNETTQEWDPLESLEWEAATGGQLGPIVKIERRRSDQSHLCLAVPGLPLDHADRYALTILNVMLGDGMSSRPVPPPPRGRGTGLRRKQFHQQLPRLRVVGSLLRRGTQEDQRGRKGLGGRDERYAGGVLRARADQGQGVFQGPAVTADGKTAGRWRPGWGPKSCCRTRSPPQTK